MVHPLTQDRLKEALRHSGCPVCWEVARNSRRYLRGLLRERKASDEVWKRLEGSWGLCARHARGLLAEEPESIRGLSSATLYGRLAEALLKRARRGGFGEPRLPHRALRDLLTPRERCLACEQLGRYESAIVAGLIEAIASGEPPTIRDAYCRGDGLCLPHLRVALGFSEHPSAVDLLAAQFMNGLEALAQELDGFAASFGPDAPASQGSCSDVWIRAAERFAGSLIDHGENQEESRR